MLCCSVWLSLPICCYSIGKPSSYISELTSKEAQSIAQEPKTMLQILPLPEGDLPPSYKDMADLLVKGLLETDRAEARAILIEQILPQNLIGLPYHPKPRRLAEVVYEELAEELKQGAPAQRMSVLRAAACRAEIREQAVSSLSMAIARYLKDRPNVTDAAKDWLDPMVEKWMAMSLVDIEDEASRRLQKLERWERTVTADYSEIWNAYRLEFLHTKLNLQSARSGSFSTAAGSLYDFLISVGASVDNLDIH